jgi:transcription initiation factor IIE alpha subunit
VAKGMTEDDLLKALEAALQDKSAEDEGGEGVTSVELAEQLGKSSGYITYLLRIAMRKGLIETEKVKRWNKYRKQSFWTWIYRPVAPE